MKFPKQAASKAKLARCRLLGIFQKLIGAQHMLNDAAKPRKSLGGPLLNPEPVLRAGWLA
jgi:hypothetical protein